MLTFYKPNKHNKGSLINFSIAAGKSKDPNKPFKEGAVFINMVKQTAWNEQFHTGSFKGGENIGIKLSLNELGKMIHTLEGGERFSTFHKGNEQSTQIAFSPWLDKETKEKRGYGLQVLREQNGNKQQFSIGFQFGEDITLRKFLELAMEHILLANYAEDKRKYETFSFSSKVEKQEPQENSSQLVDDSEIEALFNI